MECSVIIWIVVLHDPPAHVFGLPNVCFARWLTDDHIRKESIAHTLKPTIRRGELTADRSIRRGESYSGSRKVEVG